MNRIAFFSDDDAGALCARLVCLGLSALSGPITLALAASAGPDGVSAEAPEGTSVIALAPNANAFDIERAVCLAAPRGGDFVAALPLGSAADRGLRNQFDVVVTVGSQQASASRALRAARYVATDGVGIGLAVRPAWFLAGPRQSELRTKARLSPSSGPCLPFATRALPMALPWLSSEEHRRLAAWEADASLMGTGMILAALALCVAADPEAKRLEAADVAALMTARTLSTERALSDRLVSLATAYAHLDLAADGSGQPSRPPGSNGRRAVPVRSAGSPARRPSDGERAFGIPRRA
ncbi:MULTISPECIES: hypothetical protein [unclassified Methylobacterium]|uniref:hypothetical protein n=1 Tax=unclassified Methylobacterium TaxID=2615210 RepID=UPI0008EF2A00|nr:MULTISPECIES: hypothetical protein [unclassified Methylobacterium]SFU97708.1 hypothetical protein SAMN02799643_03612 [Methylobacterium sp. UNCCL125]